MRRFLPKAFLLWSVLAAVVACAMGFVHGDWDNFRVGMASALGFAFFSLTLSTTFRVEDLEKQVDHHRKFMDRHLGAIVDALPADVHGRYLIIREMRREAEDPKACDHQEHEREWVVEAGMFRCTACGAGLIGPRP